jgi:acyl CoA:acetate/3-ketoacid CoA transferase alpha subunit
MTAMNKLRSLHDAIAADVHDGASIVLGCAKDHRAFL